MFKKGVPIFLKVLTPLHAGTGQELGIVDLPIQRERHTGFPKIESSGLKGSIREVMKELLGENDSRIEAAFGPENGSDHAAMLGFTEARLLLFPVKSARGVFAFITCPLAVQRLIRELKIISINDLPPLPSENTVPASSNVFIETRDGKKNVILEEYSFEVRKDENTQKLAEWIKSKAGVENAPEKLVVIPDSEFKDLVNLGTEVITRIRIDSDTGVVKKGALFTEEFLPSETVLYSIVLSTPLMSEKITKAFDSQVPEERATQVLEFLFSNLPAVIQIGGDATLGKGLVAIKRWEV